MLDGVQGVSNTFLSEKHMMDNVINSGSSEWCNRLGYAMSLGGSTVQGGAKFVRQCCTAKEGESAADVEARAFNSFGLADLGRMLSEPGGAAYVKAMSYLNDDNQVQGVRGPREAHAQALRGRRAAQGGGACLARWGQTALTTRTSTTTTTASTARGRHAQEPQGLPRHLQGRTRTSQGQRRRLRRTRRWERGGDGGGESPENAKEETKEEKATKEETKEEEAKDEATEEEAKEEKADETTKEETKEEKATKGETKEEETKDEATKEEKAKDEAFLAGLPLGDVEACRRLLKDKPCPGTRPSTRSSRRT